MKQIMLLCTTACILLGVSCKKEEERITLRTEMITANQWRVSALDATTRVGNAKVSETDYYDLMPDCERDNLIAFNADQTVTIDEGPEKCNPDAPQSYTVPDGKWAFKMADTQLELSDTAGAVVWDILLFNDTALIVQSKVTTDDTITTTTTAKYAPVR